jgi:hypothetical protein
MPTNQPQPIPPGMERPPGLPTSPPPPRVCGKKEVVLSTTKPDIRLTIYRDGAGAIYISGFATVQQAIEYGNEWTPRLWWRVKQNGVVVAEEPLGAKR